MVAETNVSPACDSIRIDAGLSDIGVYECAPKTIHIHIV